MSDIEQIELSLKEAKRLVRLRDAAVKLSSNRDFVLLIQNQYFVEESARLVGLLAEPEVKQHREEVIEAMHGIAQLKAFLRNTIQIGNIAENEISEYHEALDEAHAGDED